MGRGLLFPLGDAMGLQHASQVFPNLIRRTVTTATDGSIM